jgi:hypothetical protein
MLKSSDIEEWSELTWTESWTRLDLKTGNYKIQTMEPQFIETSVFIHAQFQQVHSLGRCQRLAQKFPESHS